MAPLILASASPQRRTLLEGLGLTFEIVPSALNENDHPEQDPVARAMALASLKAKDVSAHRSEAWVIGCDTLVVAEDGTLLEKPADASDARRMLDLHSGKTCMVHSGLSLVSPGGQSEQLDASSSSVTFKELTNAEKEWWIGTNLWQGRSGGFQIDGIGQLMIEKIEGDWTSVVGFPVYLFGELCRKAGAPFLNS
jgi:septum formation protein